MSTHIKLNLLNVLRKERHAKHFITFSNYFNQFNNTGVCLLYMFGSKSTRHMYTQHQ